MRGGGSALPDVRFEAAESVALDVGCAGRPAALAVVDVEIVATEAVGCLRCGGGGGRVWREEGDGDEGQEGGWGRTQVDARRDRRKGARKSRGGGKSSTVTP